MAADLYWDGSGTSWNSPGSWSTDAGAAVPDPPAVPGSGDLVHFSTTTVGTAQTVNLDENQSVSGLRFDGRGNTLLQGGGTNRVLAIGAEGIIATGVATNSSSATQSSVIGSTTAGQQVAISLMAGQRWESSISGTVAGADGITVRNGVSLGVSGEHTLQLGGTSGSSVTNAISGVISDGSGTLHLELNGGNSNRWTFSGNNTYSGTTTISSGALTISNANALGATGASSGTIVADGAGLFFRSTVAGTMAAESLTLNGQGPDSKGALRNVGGTNTWHGEITFGSAGNVAIGSDAGSLTLSSTADISSTFTNTLRFVTTSSTATGTVVVNGNISGDISVDKTYAATSFVTFGGDAKDYTGTTTVTTGYLTVNTALTATSAVTVENTGILRGDGGSINTSAVTTIRSGGRFAAGATNGSIGTFSMGALDLQAGSIFAVDFNTDTMTSDVVTITGDLSIDATNAAVLSLGNLGTATITSGEFLFLEYTGVWNGGLFVVDGNVIGDNAETFEVDGGVYQLAYNHSVDGRTGVALIAVPEPAGVSVVLLAGLMGMARRRR